MRIRTQFAAPFVMVVATACGGGSNVAPHKNPPRPTEPAAAAACEQQKEGDACTTGYSCKVANSDGCGLTGYTCNDGAWHAVQVACNPPPPSE
ncbi:MAG: hypothetical protein KIT31_04570 [Deltaproteobacteria bacterium]|nr:hypothetical protein [Deltaproteobacteria bacterium]